MWRQLAGYIVARLNRPPGLELLALDFGLDGRAALMRLVFTPNLNPARLWASTSRAWLREFEFGPLLAKHNSHDTR